MSYCVNCGVELEQTCRSCPLCGTPVYNPAQPINPDTAPPFPARRGTAEQASRKEFIILMSIICATVSIVCYILNHWIFSRTRWSVYVIGLSILLWIFLLPVFFPKQIRAWMSILSDGLSIAAYLFVISRLHPGNGWYPDIAVPIIGLGLILILNYYFFSLRRKSSLITRTAILFGSLGALCVAIELLIHLHYGRPLHLSWSAIVLTCCIAIDVILVSICLLHGVREELRRRMHF